MHIKNTQIHNGLAITSKITIGKAYILDREKVFFTQKYVKKNKKSIANEHKRYENAVKKATMELQKMEQETAKMKDVSAIFCGHRLILEELHKQKEIPEKIDKHCYKAEYAIQQLIKKYKKKFSKSKNEIHAKHLNDLQDIEDRLLKHLSSKNNSPHTFPPSSIIVAKDITPSQAANFPLGQVVGVAMDVGGKTSHTAIVARIRGIQAIVGMRNGSHKIFHGDIIILDGIKGCVIIRPDKNTLQEYERLQQANIKINQSLKKIKHLKAKTQDGHIIKLHANIDSPSEVKMALSQGASGIGLYRTEFIYAYNRHPTEETHFKAYSQILERLKGRPLVIRTLDFGADKNFNFIDKKEANPSLGCRSIRLCFEKENIFKDQLRAILRVSNHGKVHVMFPMISSLEDLTRAKAIFESVKQEFREKKWSYDHKIKTGIMIEIPSVAITCDLMVKEVDFFSIGTNDLIQYTLAVDRTNENVASFYKPTHPAIFRLIDNIIKVGKKNKIKVSLCGEVSKEMILCLIGMGLCEFSLSPSFIPEVKKMIRDISFQKIQKIADKIFEYPDSEKIQKYLISQLSIIDKKEPL